ncbi:hypothetical protein FI667_g6557, partial [Globisporangium splendens]
MHLEATKIVNAANASSADCRALQMPSAAIVKASVEDSRILVSSIVLHIVPVYGATPSTADDSTSGDAKEVRVDGEDTWLQVFETVSAPLLKDTNAVGENATKCLCSVLRPTEFDGHTLPSDETLLAHATRVHSFFRSILSASVAKMNGSMMYASFSPTFLLLRSACQLAHETNSRCGFKELFACIVPYAGFIFEAIEDVFQYAPREDWVLRKRGIELLTMLLEHLALSGDAVAELAKEYFQLHLVRGKASTNQNVAYNGSGQVFTFREAAIPTVIAFDKLDRRFEKQSPAKDVTITSPPLSSTHFQSSARGRGEDDEEQTFGDLSTDEASAPEHQTEDDETPTAHGLTPLAEKPAEAKAGSSLKQFMAKKRAQVSKRWKQIPRISPPKSASKPLEAFAFPEEDENDDTSEIQQKEEKETEDAYEEDNAEEMSRSEVALQAAQSFIELLEDGDHDDTTNDPFGTHDAWLVFTWLRDLSKRNTNVKQIDPRALRALEQRLVQWSMTPSAAGLEAAHVLSQLGF